MIIEQLIANIKSVGIFAVVLSILIVVHEWGHYITAKRAGIGVERFSLGFGPKLFSKVFNGTEFLLCLIPLGGYVKMMGDERSECTGDAKEFYSQPPGKRALVILNGPVVNFIFAYLCLVCVFLLGYPGGSTKITKIEINGPAHKAGLMVGDKIIEVDSTKVYGLNNLRTRLEGSTDKRILISVVRNEQKIDAYVEPTVTSEQNILGENRSVRDIGISLMPNKIGDVREDYPAYKAGLREGDKIIQIDSNMIFDWEDIYNSILKSTGEIIQVRFIRDEKEMTVEIGPKIEAMKNESGETVERRIVGISPLGEFDSFRFGLVNSVRFAFEELVFITVTTYKSIYYMITGAISAKESVTGPVGIFYVIKEAARMGLSHLLFILGVISASLAIFNLLPVVPLDGGHLLFLGIEKVRGKPLSEKTDEIIAKVGFTLIIFLALFVFYSDFSRQGWIEGIQKIFGKMLSLFKF
ncbi:MAG: RIP metalloprotease RseP [Omnitrophica WOR_2 bacterium GWF2_38_59]|nr:MAG: RIP metalloprotease RseP [Omnitrophica WOR_2 bacterium GWA2_37_7]OGX23818.1 MAG: RIP metalloprotease RseP [Omnitrophica WOR_2 bacterium GWF2_38_59]OGX47760.1 MAG: RIP metalloprotease RseP [Omnitrophica WOR_2 bacterium RIFOXYA2_FULL_38_17]OGX51160.1 MAG: RIP metalloprotease RseP [Omnitrophica WOR_2 bacterium RIFOXYA12_FULL_38_10]OGX56011.1 MAG: RIP metalloprotease RseP [Omnitrophica WOR_2 bacterium RIFOXYB2_FULL_38_16]OGX57711.1 MAG: RIP metalloprotease RseP [Omnitrophica WOR_2 bacteriu